MQTDPIGYYDSLNMYQYCNNNPLNYRDPWGLSACTCNYPIMTEEKLLEVLQDYYDTKLKDMRNPLRLFVSGGDTDFYKDNKTYCVQYTKNGKKKTLHAKGHYLNYIGVGAGFKKFHMTPFMPIVATYTWNALGHHNIADPNEVRFSYWGYTHYTDVDPHCEIHR